MLVLVIGDLHIPQRASNLPSQFRKLLIPGKIQRIICTGNVCDQATYNYLRAICPNIDIVQGDFDEFYNATSLPSKNLEDAPRSPKQDVTNQTWPQSKIVEIEGFRIGIVHGHQMCPANGDVDSLVYISRYMDVDLLCSGNTHRFEAYEEDGRFFVNPGSATGVFSALEHNPTPSFVLMDMKESHLVAYVYQLVDNKVSVDKIEYTKP
ncbi:hypothetical protein BB559_007297 [Furculomyces boomerangus]|uniref:Vacuolar protein sorting-associated protein 29 n=2 Tax=Harpellales TaxID=61421 RepID=A0A2T9XY31_9FUNG|nr:hypothetical protein BB559_007297 [Furculomyces boomerangus]PVZ97622.1 hypothetical protein BB558_006423 [Smittium angustum]